LFGLIEIESGLFKRRRAQEAHRVVRGAKPLTGDSQRGNVECAVGQFIMHDGNGIGSLWNVSKNQSDHPIPNGRFNAEKRCPAFSRKTVFLLKERGPGKPLLTPKPLNLNRESRDLRRIGWRGNSLRTRTGGRR
jgi:hypothetical protein